MKVVFQTDLENGEYIGETPAQPDPLAPGNFLIPAGAYEDAPTLQQTDGKAIVRGGGGWQLVDDFRGETVYNLTTGDPLEIEILGPIPNGFSKDPRPYAPQFPQFTALEMLDLFTEEEQLTVVEATMSVPVVKLWYDRMMAATFVTYEDGRVEAGLAALIQAGLLTEQRKSEIVAAMQPEHA